MERITITLDAGLLGRLDAAAKSGHRSRSRQVTMLCEQGLGPTGEETLMERLLVAMCLRGTAVFEWVAPAVWEVSEDGLAVHRFTGEVVFSGLPCTTVPALLGCSAARHKGLALRHILAVVEGGAR